MSDEEQEATRVTGRAAAGFDSAFNIKKQHENIAAMAKGLKAMGAEQREKVLPGLYNASGGSTNKFPGRASPARGRG